MREFFSTLRRVLQLVWHQANVFFKNIRSLPPVLLWVLAVYLCYDTGFPPVNAVQGYMSASLWLFFVMVWSGYLFLSGVDMVAEHILILQINSRFLYALSKILFLMALSLTLGIIGCIYPIVIDITLGITGFEFIPGGFRAFDFAGGLIIHFTSGFLGLSLAYLFQPNPTKNRDILSLTMLMAFSLLALVKEQFFGFQGKLKPLLIIFTPLLEIVNLFHGKNIFMKSDLWLAAFYGGAYCVVALIAGYFIYNKKMYGPLTARTR